MRIPGTELSRASRSALSPGYAAHLRIKAGATRVFRVDSLTTLCEHRRSFEKRRLPS